VATWEYPLEALKAAAETALTVVGGATPTHYVGRRFVYGNHDCPRYVWIPSKGRESNDFSTRSTEEVDMTAVLEDKFLVACWGRSLAEAWAMANNVHRAIRLEIEGDQKPLQYEWVRPGEAHNQRGELVVLEYTWGIPFIDAYVDLDPEATEPEQPTVLPTGIEADVQQTDDPDDIGETAVVINTASDD
jgi:hypothetical protein